MIQIEYKINEYNKNWNELQKIAHKNLVFDMISKLRSYTEIEIYLLYYAEILGYEKGKPLNVSMLDPTANKIFKEFLSRYKDTNKEKAKFVLAKYK